METNSLTNNFATLLQNRSNNYILTLNYTGEYYLPTSPTFECIGAIDTSDGDLHIYKTTKEPDWGAYIQDTLIPHLQDLASKRSGDDDYYDNLPALKEEAIELVYQISPDLATRTAWLEAIDNALPDPQD